MQSMARTRPTSQKGRTRHVFLDAINIKRRENSFKDGVTVNLDRFHGLNLGHDQSPGPHDVPPLSRPWIRAAVFMTHCPNGSRGMTSRLLMTMIASYPPGRLSDN